MSVYIDHIKTDNDLPITYSINIKTLSTSKEPVTCCITAAPRISKQRTTNHLNYIKPSTCIERTPDHHRSSIHLPVTYSTSIHVPCHSSTIKPHPPLISPSPPSNHHHYHHYHHYHYYHHRQPLSSRPSTTIKHKTPQRPTSIGSTRPTTTSTTTFTSPESLKKAHKNIHSPLPNLTSHRPDKQPSHHHHSPLPSYSALVWNWFHHIPTKTSPNHKGSQSDYSETCRHESPSKRHLLFKLITSSKHPRTCFSRKRLESSSSLPNKYNNYNE